MKKTYITPTFIVEEIVDDMNILAGSPTDPESGRNVNGGGPVGEIMITGLGDDDDDSGETAAKGNIIYLTYDEEW